MSKSKLIFFTICVLVLFSQASVLASFEDNEYTEILSVINGTNIDLGAGYTSLNVLFAGQTGSLPIPPAVESAANVGAIYIAGNSTATLSSSLTSLTTAATSDTLTSRHGIVVNGYIESPTTWGTASLTVGTTDLFTINHNVKISDAILVINDGHLIFNGPIEITTNGYSTQGINVAGTGSTATFHSNVTITANQALSVPLLLSQGAETVIFGNLTIHTKEEESRGMFIRGNDTSLTVKGNTYVQTSGGKYSGGIEISSAANVNFEKDVTVVIEGDDSIVRYSPKSGHDFVWFFLRFRSFTQFCSVA